MNSSELIKKLGEIGVHTIQISPKFKSNPVEVLITSQQTILFDKINNKNQYLMTTFQTKSLEETYNLHNQVFEKHKGIQDEPII